MIPYHLLSTSSLYRVTNSGYPNPATDSIMHPTEILYSWSSTPPAAPLTSWLYPQGEIDNEQECNGRVEVCQTRPYKHPFTPQTSSSRKQSPQPSLPSDSLSPIPCNGTIQWPGASSSKRQNIILSAKWSSISPPTQRVSQQSSSVRILKISWHPTLSRVLYIKRLSTRQEKRHAYFPPSRNAQRKLYFPCRQMFYHHSLQALLKCDSMSHDLCHPMSDTNGLFCLFSVLSLSWALT